MYYASVGDAAFLDAITDRATEAFDDLTSSAKSEAERVAKETIATIVPSTPAPRVGLSARVGGAVRRAPLGLGLRGEHHARRPAKRRRVHGGERIKLPEGPGGASSPGRSTGGRSGAAPDLHDRGGLLARRLDLK